MECVCTANPKIPHEKFKATIKGTTPLLKHRFTEVASKQSSTRRVLVDRRHSARASHKSRLHRKNGFHCSREPRLPASARSGRKPQNDGLAQVGPIRRACGDPCSRRCHHSQRRREAPRRISRSIPVRLSFLRPRGASCVIVLASTTVVDCDFVTSAVNENILPPDFIQQLLDEGGVNRSASEISALRRAVRSARSLSLDGIY